MDAVAAVAAADTGGGGGGGAAAVKIHPCSFCKRVLLVICTAATAMPAAAAAAAAARCSCCWARLGLGAAAAGSGCGQVFRSSFAAENSIESDLEKTPGRQATAPHPAPLLRRHDAAAIDCPRGCTGARAAAVERLQGVLLGGCRRGIGPFSRSGRRARGIPSCSRGSGGCSARGGSGGLDLCAHAPHRARMALPDPEADAQGA